jgi:hypothetical protein
VIDKGQSSRLVALPCVSWTRASTVSCPLNLHPISTVTPSQTLMFYLLLVYRTVFLLVPSLRLYFSVTFISFNLVNFMGFSGTVSCRYSLV